MHSKQVTSLLLMLVFSTQAWASDEEEEHFPSHCHVDEHVYLNAKMDYEQNAQGYRLSEKRGVILSICAESKSEPINVLAVRYGIIGASELELKGDSNNKVKVHLGRTGPGMARQTFIFSIGRRTYYISEGVGLEHGVSFYAIDGKKTISYGESSEYQHGEFEIDFESPKSPVFTQEPSSHFLP